MPSVAGLTDIGKRVASDFSEKNVTFMAAGIAYNAIVSLAPILILLVLIVSLVGGGLEARLRSVAENALPGPIADVVTQIFAGDAAATSASVVGVVVLVWGTLKVFRGLDTAFSEIYETEGKNPIKDQIIDGLVVLVALVVAIVATIGVSIVFAAFADVIPFLGLLTPVVLIGGLLLAFLPMYYRFPDKDLGWRDVLPGALFAAIGWAALQAVFQVYLLFKGSGTGGFFGGTLIVLTWLYFSGLVLLLGAVLNAVIGGHSTGRPGGVGRAAAQGAVETEYEAELDRDEASNYLRDLRERLTGYYEEMEPTSEPPETDSRPTDGVEVIELDGTLQKVRPITAQDRNVEVIERSERDDDGEWRTVTLRWKSDGTGSDT